MTAIICRFNFKRGIVTPYRIHSHVSVMKSSFGGIRRTQQQAVGFATSSSPFSTPIISNNNNNYGALQHLLSKPTRFMFFTGKGGVGKTSLSAATALGLADSGRRVLLVSTDAASNLDEMLSVKLCNGAERVPNVPNLSVLNIDPNVAATEYRKRVLATVATGDRDKVREELSGACTTEIAAFDEFTLLLASRDSKYDHVIFDTAPTGHTLRLLSLPKAWSGFLEVNQRGASCLGPHSGLKMQEQQFRAALETLGNPSITTVVLVTRPEASAVAEAERTSAELRALGLANQHLVVNGVFRAIDRTDPIALSIEDAMRITTDNLPPALRELPHDNIPLRAFDTIGVAALRALATNEEVIANTEPLPTTKPISAVVDKSVAFATFPRLNMLADQLADADNGLIMIMGKGGVGKTTIAAALAVGLVMRGKQVHLSTTDPAAHLTRTIQGSLSNLTVDRIDPALETRKYVEKIMASRGRGLDEQGRALLLEDLRSPCTEEVAVFHAFSRVVGEAKRGFVVLDTAPTGHSLLLLDATGAYHRQALRDFSSSITASAKIITPLMRLQDATYTRIILVTLPETTPISQAINLQNDLQRANINPYAWVVNKSIGAAGTLDPLLLARLDAERRQIERLAATNQSGRTFIVPWLASTPVGVEALSHLTAPLE